MKEHVKSKAKLDDKSLFGKHCNDEGHSSEAEKQKFKTLHTETFTRRRKLKEQLEIVSAKEEETNLEEQFVLFIDRNKGNTQPVGNTNFIALFCNQNNQWEQGLRARRD